MSTPTPPSTSTLLQVQISKSVHVAVVLGLLYFGRDVLVPITLALILSLLFAPLVRVLKRFGLGQAPAVIGAVTALAACVAGLAVVAGLQVVNIAASLPQYEATIRSKLQQIQKLTVGQTMEGETGRMFSRLADQAAGTPEATVQAGNEPAAQRVVPVEIHERPPTAARLMSQMFTTVWEPLGKAGIVLIVLVFVLLEHDALRDRFIRLAGSSDLHIATHALNDAGDRLSRYFVSQFAVNLAVGAAVGIGLFFIGLPHALLWAVLTMVLRFVPYVGVAVAAVSASLLAAAVDPGWAMVLWTLGLFAVVEVVSAQVVEPQLYGHSTGLSPLSVVIAAIFWSWIWGPLGLLMAVPLTLCLVVAGRHVEPLKFLDVLLGDAPALSMSQRFYQRALSGDADEIIGTARSYLKRGSFAKYADAVLMPALRMGLADLEAGRIDPEQQRLLKEAIVQVIETLGADGKKGPRKLRRGAVLDETGNIGLHLRQRRESVSGQWQGPLAVPVGSIVLCVGLGSLRDDLITEILVRILRDSGIDARHRSLADAQSGPPPGANVESVALVFVVSSTPAQDWRSAAMVAAEVRRRAPSAGLVAAFPATPPTVDEVPANDASFDQFAYSFEEALKIAAARIAGASR